jgi:hypothetical protein
MANFPVRLIMDFDIRGVVGLRFLVNDAVMSVFGISTGPYGLRQQHIVLATQLPIRLDRGWVANA